MFAVAPMLSHAAWAASICFLLEIGPFQWLSGVSPVEAGQTDKTSLNVFEIPERPVFSEGGLHSPALSHTCFMFKG